LCAPVFLMYHIQVCLKDYLLPVLHPWACRLADQYISDGIPEGFQSEGFSEILHKCNYPFLFFGRPGYGVELGEVLPDHLGLQGCNGFGHNMDFGSKNNH